ncbi:Binding partner of ACD11 1 [Linum grandiflorum]
MGQPLELSFLFTIKVRKVSLVYLFLSQQVTAVKVGNVSLGATELDLKEFFSFSGEIDCIIMQSDTERSQSAYLRFKEPQGAETAILLSGATIVDQSVTIELAPEYEFPAAAQVSCDTSEKNGGGRAEIAIQKAEDVVSGMLARGFCLGKDALKKAKTFDEKLQLTSTASSLDQKIGLSEKISAGRSVVNEKVREMDEKLKVSEAAKAALTAAEQSVSSAGSAIMKNRYVLTGASWVSGAFGRVSKVAGEVGQKTKEKVLAEEEGANKAVGFAGEGQLWLISSIFSMMLLAFISRRFVGRQMESPILWLVWLLDTSQGCCR